MEVVHHVPHEERRYRAAHLQQCVEPDWKMNIRHLPSLMLFKMCFFLLCMFTLVLCNFQKSKSALLSILPHVHHIHTENWNYVTLRPLVHTDNTNSSHKLVMPIVVHVTHAVYFKSSEVIWWAWQNQTYYFSPEDHHTVTALTVDACIQICHVSSLKPKAVDSDSVKWQIWCVSTKTYHFSIIYTLLL